MASQELIKALEQEQQALTRELENSPAFQRLQAVRSLLALYREPAPKPIDKVRTFVAAAAPRPKSQTAVIVKAAETYLRETGRRFTSGPLTDALTARGIDIPGNKKSARLASMLAAKPKIFNNVPGQGYGLAEWGDANTSPDNEQNEAPDPARSSAPNPNGGYPSQM